MLKFTNDKFKILQLTDIHYIHDDPRSQPAIDCIEMLITTEKPDLIIITGDIIYAHPGEYHWHAFLKMMDNYNIPFAYTFGNHDEEQGLTTKELYDIGRRYKYNITKNVENIDGVANGLYQIYNNGAPVWDIFCFDSGSYAHLSNDFGYDFIKHSQIDWYRRESQNHNLPALAFFHIPFIEYFNATNLPDTADARKDFTGHDEDKDFGYPALNTGLFYAFKDVGNIKGVFTGHFHDNDYSIKYLDILLAYGRYSGGNTEYNNLKPNGGRVISLNPDGTFETYIRLADGQKIATAKMP